VLPTVCAKRGSGRNGLAFAFVIVFIFVCVLLFFPLVCLANGGVVVPSVLIRRGWFVGVVLLVVCFVLINLVIAFCTECVTDSL
jgi:uncharacterized membrane protein (DUF485 family)